METAYCINISLDDHQSKKLKQLGSKTKIENPTEEQNDTDNLTPHHPATHPPPTKTTHYQIEG